MVLKGEPKEYYDQVYERVGFYAPSGFKRVVQKYVLRCLGDGKKILDIGCGSGWFAKQCVEAGYSYVGIDWSTSAIMAAREAVPSASFYEIDVEKNQSIIRRGDFDVIVFISFLEHVEKDIEIIKAIPSGKRVVIVVPNSMAKGHTRVFKNPEAIFERYGELINFSEESFNMSTTGESPIIDWIRYGVTYEENRTFLIKPMI